MNRMEFDDLSIEQQLNYINKRLKEGLTITETCKQIGIGRSTMTDRAKKIGKKYNSKYNQYIKINNDDSTTNVIKPLKANKHRIYDNGETAVTKCEDNEVLNNNDISKTLVNNKQVLKNILDLSENHDKIIEVLKWFEDSDKGKTNVIEVHEGIKINLPDSANVDFRLTVRLNDTVWKQFSEFCKEHKEFNLPSHSSPILLGWR